MSIKDEEGALMESIVLTIAERLKDLRKSRGITLEALAKDAAISKSALVHIRDQ